MASDYESTVAKIDSYRARKIGEMLVTQNAPEFMAEPEDVLVDIEALSGKELLAQYQARQAKYGTTPFDPEGKLLRLYPGGLTIWSGFPGAGKTTLLRQLVCHILKRGSSVFLASLEENPRDMLVRLAATAAGKLEPSADDIAWFQDAYAKRFRLWGVMGIAKHLKLLAVIRKLAEQGVRHAVIDSLMCLDVSNKDIEAQKDFANLVATTARVANIHLHLVAHPRKLISADQEPDLNDVAGAKELGGVADNVIFVRRSKTEAVLSNSTVTPMVVSVKKQRHHTGATRDVGGWLHHEFRQFHIDQFASQPTRYLPDEAYA